MNKRFINLRWICICAIAFGLGLFFARDILTPVIFVIITISILLLVALVYFILTKKLVRFFIIIGCFMFGVGYFYAGLYFYKGETFNGVQIVSGRIDEVVKTTDTYYTVFVENFKVDGKDIRTNLKLTISLNDDKNFKQGDVLSFKSEVNSVKMFELREFNTYYYRNNIAYETLVYSSDVSIVDSSLKFTEKFFNNIKFILNNSMSKESAEMSYASLFGDRIELSKEIYDNFKITGIAHLIAVSGMHVVIIAAAFSFILNKIRIKKFWQFILLCPILIFYAYLCNFTSSVVRATIMIIILLFARAFGKEHDSLTTLSFAAIIIMLINPLTVFDAAFQLSFFCVFALILFVRPLSKFFIKIKIPKFLAVSLASIIAVQIGIFPLTVKYMGTISFSIIIVNLISIPLFEIAFILNLIFLPFIAISSAFSFLLFPSDLIFNNLIQLATLFSGATALKLTYSDKYFSIFYFILIFLLSGFFMASRKVKAIVFFSVVCLLACFQYLNYADTRLTKNSISVLNVYGNYTYIVCDNENDYYLIDYEHNIDNYSDKVEKFLAYNKIKTIKYIFIAGEFENNKNYRNFMIKYLNTKIVNVFENNGTFEAYNPVNIPKMFVFNINSIKIAIIDKSISQIEKDNIEYYYDEYNFDLILTSSYENFELNTQVIFSNNNSQSQIKPINMFGNFTFQINNDNINYVRCLD